MSVYLKRREKKVAIFFLLKVSLFTIHNFLCFFIGLTYLLFSDKWKFQCNRTAEMSNLRRALRAMARVSTVLTQLIVKKVSVKLFFI